MYKMNADFDGPRISPAELLERSERCHMFCQETKGNTPTNYHKMEATAN